MTIMEANDKAEQAVFGGPISGYFELIKRYSIIVACAVAALASRRTALFIVSKLPKSVTWVLGKIRIRRLNSISVAIALAGLAVEFGREAVATFGDWNRIFNRPWVMNNNTAVVIEGQYQLMLKESVNWRAEGGTQTISLQRASCAVYFLIRAIKGSSDPARVAMMTAWLKSLEPLLAKVDADQEQDSLIMFEEPYPDQIMAINMANMISAYVEKYYLPSGNTPQLIAETLQWWFLVIARTINLGPLASVAVLAGQVNNLLDPDNVEEVEPAAKAVMALLSKLPFYKINVDFEKVGGK